MRIRSSRFAVAVFLAGSFAFFAAPSRAAVLSGVRLYWASGPASLLVGQTANACATNPEDSPMSVLIALAADNGSLLASRQATLQPGMGACVAYTRPIPQQGILSLQVSPNVYAVVIHGGRLESSGRIVQDRPGGGGCIVASLQIQIATPNNTPGQTILYAPMLKFRDAGRGNND